jgi:hypothetical protein
MTLAALSHRARAALRAILALWTRPVAQPPRVPQAVAEAQDALADAKRRRCSRDIHDAHMRARQARIDGLRAEIAARRMKEATR